MKKSLLITNFFPPAIGGVENYFYNFCRLLPPEDISVLTAIKWPSDDFDRQQPYQISRVDFFSGRLPPRWRPLLPMIKKIVQAENIQQLIFGHFHPYCLLALKLNLPFYIFGHGTDIRQIKNSWWQTWAFKKIYRQRNFQKFIANSRFIAAEAEQLVKDKTKIEVVYPGIDYAGLNSPIDDFDSKKKLLGLDENDVIMVSIGRIEPEKNYEAVIKLMPEMIGRIPQLKYVIVGDGSDLQRLKDLVEKYNLKYRVIFTGAIDQAAAAKAFYYQLGHIFITASLRPEGFGISYLEAAAAKTAVIASKFGGSAEAVKDGETGILVDPGSPEQIREAIFKLALDRELWDKMASAGQAWAKEFDWNKQMEKLKKIIT
ncbi:MAG: glycosyltransferase family 4 protein [Patescibacteria group bacterium]